MSSPNRVKLSLGGGDIGSPKLTGSKLADFLETYRKHGHVEIDAAAMYPVNGFGLCEKELSSVRSWAVVSTKIVPPLDRKSVRESIDASLERLGRGEVDILYLHFPDAANSLEETMGAVDEAYRAGKFRRVGLSNLAPELIEKFLKISEEKGYVKPSVYQGQYNLLARKGETGVLPLLRKHGMSYYAYSPAAAGFMTGKVTRESSNQDDSRWSNKTFGGQRYSAAYHQDAIFDAAAKVRSEAEKHGIHGHAAGLRWCLHHSVLSKDHGDAVVVGASSVEQLEDNLKIAEDGPLPDELVKVIEEVWPSIEPVAAWG